jgi:hypothetical protein
VSKLWQHREGLHSRWQHFSQLHDALSRSVAEEFGRLSQILHTQRVETHQAGAYAIGGGENKHRIPLVARSFTDEDGFRSQGEESARRGSHQPRVRVHFSAWDVLHQVRFQQYGLAAKVQIEHTETFDQRAVQRAVVGILKKNRNAGSTSAAVPKETSRTQLPDSQGTRPGVDSIEAEVRSRPSPIEFEMAYQARVAIDRIKFAIRHTEQFAKPCIYTREAGLQLLDALERLESLDRRFQIRSRVATEGNGSKED